MTKLDIPSPSELQDIANGTLTANDPYCQTLCENLRTAANAGKYAITFIDANFYSDETRRAFLDEIETRGYKIMESMHGAGVISWSSDKKTTTETHYDCTKPILG